MNLHIARALATALLLAAAVCVPVTQAQSPNPTRIKVDVSALGPQVGERVSDFNLVDQNGDTRTSTQHLTARAYPSDAAVALGTRFALAVDITPKRGMHVYAPGASNYKVIGVNIGPQPHIRILPLRYPASEMYRFAPLDERVPVYQKPFSLVVEVVPEATPEGRKAFSGRTELLLTGTLDYQACDDKICYNPVSLPLSWKVELKPNVTGAPQSPVTR